MADTADTPHDDRHWPRAAVPVSIVLAPVGVLVALALGANEDPPAAGLLAAVVGLVVGVTLLVSGIRPWLRGEAFPAILGLVALVVPVAAYVGLRGAGLELAGGAFLAGMVAGLMLGNLWAIRAARANRPA